VNKDKVMEIYDEISNEFSEDECRYLLNLLQDML